MFEGRSTGDLGRVHHEQGARDNDADYVGDDVRVLTVGRVRHLRRPRQQDHHIQDSHRRGHQQDQEGGRQSHQLYIMQQIHVL